MSLALASLSGHSLAGDDAGESVAASAGAADDGRGGGASDDQGSRWKFSGYDKTLAIQSNTLLDDTRYNYFLNRVRLKAHYELPQRLTVHIENDTELKAGSYLNTPQFALQQQARSGQYLGSQVELSSKGNYQLTNRFFRAYAKASWDDTDMMLGRQRIPIGTGRMWSTVDMLNPINPLQVERDEYVGVDAGMVEHRLGALSKLQAVYAPDPQRVNDRWVLQYRTNQAGVDVDALAASYWGDNVLAADMATQVGGAGVHGEYAYTRPKLGSAYSKVLVGWDYAFPNTFDISMEAYYSGQSQSDLLMQLQADPLRAGTQPLGRANLGVIMSYEFTPILKGTLYWLNNLDDHSRFVSPILDYEWSQSLTFQGGAQFFKGVSNSEYGRGKTLYYAQMLFFF